MEKFVTLRLPLIDVFQIIDGLTERMIIWKTTERYLEGGYSHFGDVTEECSDSEEARFIAEHYENIIDLIKMQLDNQK
ncbi:MAG: hypothetical protein JXA96_14310 [Sedimentisphaerales bacterium]|nr:hypothetical protein [Sedimentisphaerales bacterium]